MRARAPRTIRVADDERNRISGASFHPFSGFLPFAIEGGGGGGGDGHRFTIDIDLSRVRFSRKEIRLI